MSRTIYRTHVNDSVTYEGDNLSAAVRNWDSQSYLHNDISGGVAVQSYNAEGYMTRDGWILHVDEGHVYLNPNLEDA